jgi:hypothetical protein
LSLPGSFFASAMSSGIDFAGNEGCTQITRPLVAISPIGAKSLRGS